MIKNIIFDLGGVLIDFFPEIYLKHIGLNEEEIKLYKKMIWSSKEWCLGDRGDLSYPEILEAIYKNNPKYSKKLRYILENKNNDYILFEASFAYDYLLSLKNKGYNLYFLSNVNKFDLKYDQEHFKIFNLVDGAVYSAEVRICKTRKRMLPNIA